ncbi:hypothetical protein GCM10010840_22040 [Deinococcus aerolatus]|uniref:N-acetyltransferase domain-containing protein n=1 Tax=Deinococcus aerolatus TaxID=522487 RepID=A0ABQ2GAL8_9DEIO|nr:hypothetical protein [Deinococcus aerolatus]GGL83845.1 hypothetical protein GCM10010840_22040 [Deinococcus aerolatus]
MICEHLPTAADLARFSLAAQHPPTLKWCSEPDRLANLAVEHTFDLRLATDLELAGQRAKFINVGLPAEAYLNRWVTVAPGLEAMFSIRFKGLDVGQPFVDISATSRPVVASDFPALIGAAVLDYGDFHPPRIRVWSAAETFTGLKPDLRVLAAPLAELGGGGLAPELSLIQTTDLSHYADAQAAYAAVDAAHPEHPGQARLLSEEDLQDTIDAGTMFDVIWRGAWSGYVGTLPETQVGLPAQVVREMLLAPHARGYGLGAYLSTLLARYLPADGRVLSGTIHGENRGAQTAARQAGRQDVGGWWWVPTVR